MIIYGEYLFLENFIMGLLITYFAVKFAGKEARLSGILICGVISGVFSFSVFLPLGPVAGLVGKILAIAVMGKAALGGNTVKKLCLNAAVLLIVTFLYGGVATAVLNVAGWQGITGIKGVYIPFYAYAVTTGAGISASLVVQAALSLIKVRRRKARTEVKVRIRVKDREWEFDGFIDSGNFLREPITGKPVLIGSRKTALKIFDDEGERRARYTIIPYNSVGVRKGLLEGYRADSVTVNGVTVKNPVFAVSEGRKEARLLLPEYLTERGIYADLN